MLNETILGEAINALDDMFVKGVGLGEATDEVKKILSKHRVDDSLNPQYTRQSIIQSLYSIDIPDLEGTLSLF